MGVRRRADAGEAELDAGLAFLRAELAKLARDYPEQAERLRIPGSVEGIDQRLGAATGDVQPDSRGRLRPDRGEDCSVGSGWGRQLLKRQGRHANPPSPKRPTGRSSCTVAAA